MKNLELIKEAKGEVKAIIDKAHKEVGYSHADIDLFEKCTKYQIYNLGRFNALADLHGVFSTLECKIKDVMG